MGTPPGGSREESGAARLPQRAISRFAQPVGSVGFLENDYFVDRREARITPQRYYPAHAMRLDSRQQSCEVLTNDTLFFTWRAIVDPLDVTSLFAQAREHWEKWPRVALLWDMTGTHLLPGDARRRLLDELRKLPLVATAVITPEFYLRVPVTIVLEVASIEIPSRPPYRFFDAREPAALWLEDVRSGRTSVG